MATATSGADAPYWTSLASGGLSLPRCSGCGAWHWPAVWRCGDCGSWGQSWENVEPRGRIYAWTRTWHAFGGLEGVAAPFVSVVVALDAAPVRLTGILDVKQSQAVRIGLPVTGLPGATQFAGAPVPAWRWRLVENHGGDKVP